MTGTPLRAGLGSWIVGLVAFMTLDGIWLGGLMRTFYRTALAPIARLAPDGSFAPIWAAALPVYVLLVAGLASFVLPRASSRPTTAAPWGALFGALTYGVYDLTNLSTLRNYSVTLTVVDVAWGAFASALVATLMAATRRSA